MKEIIRVLKGHRRLALWTAAVMLAIVAGSVARCRAIHPSSASSGEAGAAAEPDAMDSQQQSDEDEADARLPEAALALRASYPDGTRQLVSLLTAHEWTALSETLTLSFSERCMRETREGTTTLTAYVITATSTKTTRETTETGEVVESKVTTFSIETPDGSYIGTLTQPQFDGGTATLSCDAFTNAKTYDMAEPSGRISVGVPDDSWCDSVGCKKEDIVEAINDYASAHYPTATSATWLCTAYFDYSTDDGMGSVQLVYALDNQASTHLTVTINLSDKTVSVSEGGN
ncbi:hypothetical protein [Olsenella profusa]|uniref:Uncharacterized protein n=1 Tax=Olsenella profusa F0195 TaxID=1125712 RepID=U2UUK7_9ACTN|nr:hypothetical protein [Olsenella profusa]ERL06782.1 hypothetical protein HMPREF1316_0506 [Olsenella profusa F0195]